MATLDKTIETLRAVKICISASRDAALVTNRYTHADDLGSRYHYFVSASNCPFLSQI